MGTNHESSDDDRGGASVRLEELVASSHERYEQVIDSAPVGIAQITIQGLIVRTNPFLSEMTAFTVDELLAMHVDDLLTADSLEARAELARFVRGAQDKVACTALCSCKDGGRMRVSVQGALVTGPDQAPVHGVMVIDHHAVEA